MLKLLCVSGIDIGNEYELSDGIYILGRKHDCDIVIIDSEASRQHCKIVSQNDSVTLHDLNSTNGLFLNGTAVDVSALISNGDIISFGNTKLQLYTELKHDYIMNSTKAKIQKSDLIDDDFRDFTTRKLAKFDTARIHQLDQT